MTLAIILFSYILIFFVLKFCTKQSIKELAASEYMIIISLGLFVRLLASFITHGFPTDMGCFSSWGETMRVDGLSSIYGASASDYPPGYMYVLCFLSYVRDVFNISMSSDAYFFLLKAPAMICDVLIGTFAYFVISKHYRKKTALLVSLVMLLSPAFILDSSIWGQVDSVLVLLLLLSIYFLVEKNMLASVLLFMAAIVVKPQALILSPVFIFDFFRYLKEENFKKEAFLRLLAYGALCALLGFTLILPFCIYNGKFNMMPVLSQYVNTLASYEYCTVNAYNIYALFGLNWKGLDGGFGVFTYNVLGILAIIGVTVASFYALYRNKSKYNYFMTSGFLYFGTFMLATKMHERYSIPAVAFIFFAFVYSKSRRVLLAHFMLSIAFILNCVQVLSMYLQNNPVTNPPVLPIISLLYCVVFGYFVYVWIRGFMKAPDSNDELTILIDKPEKYSVSTGGEAGFEADGSEVNESEVNGEEEEDSFEYIGAVISGWIKKEPKSVITDKEKKITRKDLAILLSITLVYGLISFFNLGNTKSAQTSYEFKANESVTIDFGESYEISRFQYMRGARHDKPFTLAFSEDGETFTSENTTDEETVFAWKQISKFSTEVYEPVTDPETGEETTELVTKTLDYPVARYIRITAVSNNSFIQELAFRDSNDRLIPIADITPGAEALVDEQELVPDNYSYKNSTYFDEIYHARTAYEFTEGLDIYEWTHPPLDKMLIALGIKAFGMTPFGWRFTGNLFGILMIPLIFLFAKRVFKKTFWATFLTIIYTVDFMHFAQTRIATIDTYITFFVILMYYFMFLFYDSPLSDRKRGKDLLWLFLSGLSMGLGIACKWPGIYAAAGLAILFLIAMLKRHGEFKKAFAEGNTLVTDGYMKNVIVTLLLCVLFFVVVPAGIYLASYVPYYNISLISATSRKFNEIKDSSSFLRHFMWDNGFLKFVSRVICEQIRIFDYHAYLVSEHPFSSKWWEWPLMIRPIYYFSGSTANGLRMGISSFGNPAVWWTGIAAFFYSIYKYIRSKDRLLLFIIIAYLAQLVPWMLVSRTTYIYHYFPSVPFVAMMITYMFRSLDKNRFRKRVYAYLMITVAMFILFYPVLSGFPIRYDFVDIFLKWPIMPRWVLA